ncbi:helix-turn-helix domain-containing protein [Tenacibaculum sp. L6]
MTPNAFCRYFKQRTNKTYFTFLNELRIENACKLLSSDKSMAISEIAYQCGFNNLSNFNRKFKEVKSMSPSIFRKNN